MGNQQSPTIQEFEFLKLAYSRFEEIWQIYTKENFYEKSPEHRFFYLKDSFGIYSEVIQYKSLNHYLTNMEINQERLWLIMNVEFPKVVRNIVLHFPFSKWDDVYINKSLATWSGRKGGVINKFFEEYKGYEPITCKVELKDNTSDEVKINFPPTYDNVNKIYLKDLINEETGVNLFLTLMKTAMFSQLKSLKESAYYNTASNS